MKSTSRLPHHCLRQGYKVSPRATAAGAFLVIFGVRLRLEWTPFPDKRRKFKLSNVRSMF
jgi:hypothetical protein